jgi:hypothetical protein
LHRWFGAEGQGNIEAATDFKTRKTRWRHADNLKRTAIEGKLAPKGTRTAAELSLPECIAYDDTSDTATPKIVALGDQPAQDRLNL